MLCWTLQSFPSSCKDKFFCLSHRFLIEFLSLNILHILFVVRVFDRWTCNQTCFNAARALKPLNNGEAKTPHSVEFPPGTTVPGCDFCSPLDYTAAGELFSWLLSHLQSIENLVSLENKTITPPLFLPFKFGVLAGLSKVASCWLKWPPTCLVSASYYAWHFFADGVF